MIKLFLRVLGYRGHTVRALNQEHEALQARQTALWNAADTALAHRKAAIEAMTAEVAAISDLMSRL